MARKAKMISAAEMTISQQFRIPCFAHQELDPSRFPEDVGSPIGGPLSWTNSNITTECGNGSWEDSDDGWEVNPDKEWSLVAPRTLGKHRRQSQKIPNSSYKKLKVAGGRPAIAKKVTANLDSDDELILRMKNAKYLEKDIAQRMVDEGRIAYNPKTIGTRWARMKKVLQKQQDDLLDAELTDWHDGDDDVLEQAIRMADKAVEKLKAQADAKKWRIVADQMKLLKPVVNFSHNACRDRFESLIAGTAKPTPESITDPDENVLTRIYSRAERQRKIEEDRDILNRAVDVTQNLEGSGWTSRMRTYF